MPGADGQPVGEARTAAPRQLLCDCYRAALAAVNGERCVVRHLQRHPVSGPLAVIAIGKAADAMLRGVLRIAADEMQSALLVSAPGHIGTDALQDRRIRCVYGGHPRPDCGSLRAGRLLLEFLARIPAQTVVLVLLSGGASSLVEVPADSVTLQQLRAANRWLLASGLDIAQINRVRYALSAIKGGRLRRWLGRHAARVLLISDVPGDAPALIGSGLLCEGVTAGPELPELPPWLAAMLTDGEEPLSTPGDIPHHVIGTLQMALQAAAGHARSCGHAVRIQGQRLSGDATATAVRLVGYLQDAAPGVYLWGGETTVMLPARPGRGGRCQHLALSAAAAIAGDTRITLLAAGTDGYDGNSHAAGAVVDGSTLMRAGVNAAATGECLLRADSGALLQDSGDQLVTGPTGTNVADIVIGLRAA